MNPIQQAPIDNTDHFEVNKYMLSLGFEWVSNRFDAINKWVKGTIELSQAQAADLYNAIPLQPVGDINVPHTQPDTNHVDKIDEIADKLRYCYYYVDYHANKTQAEINSDIEAVVKEAKAQLRNYIESEKSKSFKNGYDLCAMENNILEVDLVTKAELKARNRGHNV